MRKIYTLILLLISILTFSQKQITELSGKATETHHLEPIGLIGSEFFYLNPYNSISKINVKAFETSRVIGPLGKDKNHVSLVSNNRLFYAITDYAANEVIITEVDADTGNVINKFSFPNSSYLSKINDVYYIISNNLWLKVYFDESEMYVEEIFEHVSTYYDSGFLMNRIISGKNKAGEAITGFWDANNTFNITKGIDVGLMGEELSDYYVFYSRTGFGKAFVYDKNTGKEIKFESLADVGFIRFFEGEEGELYLLESFERYSQSFGEQRILYRVYQLSEGSFRNHVMETELKEYNYYLSGGGIFGPTNGTSYSNVLYFNKHVYFWVNDSKWMNAQAQMRLVSINLETREVPIQSLSEEVVEALRFSYPSYGLHLMVSEGKIVSTTRIEDYVSINYDPDTFRFNIGRTTSQKVVVVINDTLNLNFSYPQRIIVEDSSRHLLKVIGDSAFYEVNSIYNYFTTPEKLVIPDGFNLETYTYDGEGLHRIMNNIKEGYLLMHSNYWTGIKVFNKCLIYVHGLRVDGTTGGDYYTFDINTHQAEKVFSADSPYLAPFYAEKAGTEKFVMIDLNDGKYVITDFENYYALNLPKAVYDVEFVHGFGNKTFLLRVSGEEESLYHFNPVGGNLKAIGISASGNNFYSRNNFYSFENNSLVKIDDNGDLRTIVGRDESLNVEKTPGSELVFFTSQEFGKIELVSGDMLRKKAPDKSGSVKKIFKLDNRYFGILSDGELVRIDFDKGSFNKIANERFGYSRENADSKVYLFRYEDSSKETEVWKFDGTVLREQFRFDADTPSIRSFSQPAVFSNTDYPWQLWIPASERVTKLDSGLVKHYRDFRYLGDAEDICYFMAAGKNGEFANNIISINVRSGQVRVLLKTNQFVEYFRMFSGQLFISNSDGIWESDMAGTTMTLVSSLRLVTLYDSEKYTDFFEFRNNLYFWAYDKKRRTQLYQLTDNISKNTILATENPAITFHLYPNPTQGLLNLSSTSESQARYKITIISTDGKILSEQNIGLPQRLDLSGLKTGVYLINVRSGRESRTFRIIKQ